MASTIARVFFFWFALLLLVQPLLSHLDYLMDLAVKSNAEYAAQKAAPEGGVTEELRNTVEERLVAMGFPRSSVEITYTAEPQERGQRIDVWIHAPRLPMMLYRFGSVAYPDTYYAHAVVMSEYIP